MKTIADVMKGFDDKFNYLKEYDDYDNLIIGYGYVGDRIKQFIHDSIKEVLEEVMPIKIPLSDESEKITEIKKALECAYDKGWMSCRDKLTEKIKKYMEGK